MSNAPEMFDCHFCRGDGYFMDIGFGRRSRKVKCKNGCMNGRVTKEGLARQVAWLKNYEERNREFQQKHREEWSRRESEGAQP